MDRRDDRRRRDDSRSHRPRYDRDRSRSRSPGRRDRRDDRRRDRSPRRGPPTGPTNADRDNAFDRSFRPASSNGPARNANERPPSRDVKDIRANSSASRASPKREPDKVSANIKPEDEDSEAEMQRIMGFKGFRSTQNTKVPGNDKNYAVHKQKKTEYRQYMNRVGGFNRPLSPSRN